MSLRERILVVLFLILGCYTALEYGVLKYVIAPELRKQEHELARQTLQRCIDALDEQLDQVHTNATALGKSGVLVPCTTGAAVTSVSLSADASDLDFILVYDYKWQLQTSNGLNADSLAKLEKQLFDKKNAFIDTSIPGYSKRGLLRQDGTVLLLSSAAITKPSTPHRVEGTLIAGRLFKQKDLESLGNQLYLNLHWDILDPAHLSGQSKKIVGSTSESNPFYSKVLGKKYLLAAAVMYDSTNRPALMVKLNQDRKIALSGLHTMSLIIFGKIIIGVVAILILTVLLQQVIISPISKLIKHIISTEHSASAQKVLALSRKDEIGILANEFNHMCKRLQNAQLKLMEKSYLSGMTEMSSGILHNVRNAISPITNRLERLKSQFDDIPLKNLQQAQAELQNEALDAERRNDLNRFVDLAFDSVVSNLMEVVEGLDDLQEQIFQVEDMLNIQRTFGKADKPIQLIEPGQLVTKALEMIPEAHRRNNRITIDAKLKKLAPVPVEPSTFLQVLQNLLVNASESLEREKPLYRKIHISAVIETENDGDILHWRIKDNGAGIAPDETGRIFERGASSKQAGLTGIGLHWCANTITAMRGCIWAESQGPHQGATFHIQIPITPVEDPTEKIQETKQ